MAPRRTTNPDFLNGVPELLILQLLARRPMHGYDVVRAIKAASGEQFDFGEGCIYPILHRLERGGALAASQEHVGSRTRIVYRVTPVGRKRLEESIGAWTAVARAVGQVLQGGGDGEPGMA